MKPEIILIGAGGHCLACIDVIEQENRFQIVGLIDLPQHLGAEVLSYPIIATDADLPRLVVSGRYFLITVGQIKSSARREELFDSLIEHGGQMPVIVSPRAYISRHAEIGAGTIVMHGAVVNAGARIGRNCIINSNALVEHGAIIHDHCHLATGSIINGDAEIGAGSFIGSRAMIREGVTIGEQVIVGGGGTVLRDIHSHTQFKIREQYETKDLHHR